MKSCIMFSGQGAQYDKMGKDLYDKFSICKDIFELANNKLDFNITDICFNNDSRLNQTRFTQPAILTTSYAIFKLLESKGLKVDFMAGLSLGEYSALCASNAITFDDCVNLVFKRGTFMEEAVPNGIGAMSAILNADEQILHKCIKEASNDSESVYIANYNTTGQIVIAGHLGAVKKCEELLKENGVRKVIPLNVSGPFHTPLLKDASQKLAIELEQINFKKPSTPVITNLTATFIDDIKDTLIKQIMSPVKWEQSIKFLIENGVDTFIEVGPSKVLSGFVKKIDRNLNVYNVEDLESLEKTCKGLGLE